MKMKVLHKGICEEMILLAFCCDEVGEAGISSILVELLEDLGLFHELIVRPLTRP